jgi:hypothetical protein
MIDEQQLRDLLLLHDLIDEGGLAAAAQLQQRHGGDLYGVLIDHGLVPEESLVALVGQVLRVPCVSLKDFKADPDLSRMLPAELAARWRAIPLGWDQTPDGKTQVYLAMANPLDMEALEELGDYAGGDVVPLLAGPIDIDQTLERVYGGVIYKLRNSLEALYGGAGNDTRGPVTMDGVAGPSVSQLLSVSISGEHDPRSVHLFRDVGSRDPLALPRDEPPSYVGNRGMLRLPTLSEFPMPEEPVSLHLPKRDLSTARSRSSSIVPVRRGPALDVDLEKLLDPSEDPMLEVGLEDEEINEELFNISDSRIFSPGALSDLGRQRLQEAQRMAGLASNARTATKRTQHLSALGDSSVPGAKLGAALPQDPPSADQERRFQIPRELTKRSVRILGRAAPSDESLDELMKKTSGKAMLRALARLLVAQGIIQADDLRAAIERERERE